MSALSCEVAGEARRRGQDKSVAAARSGWRSCWRHVAPPLPLCIPGVLLLRLLFHLALLLPSSRLHTGRAAPPRLQVGWEGMGGGAVMWCRVTGGDDAPGGQLTVVLVCFTPYDALSDAPKTMRRFFSSSLRLQGRAVLLFHRRREMTRSAEGRQMRGGDTLAEQHLVEGGAMSLLKCTQSCAGVFVFLIEVSVERLD